MARFKIIEALENDPDRRWSNRVVRMRDCCDCPAVGLTDAGAVGAVWFRCRDRMCPVCSRVRSKQVAERVAAACRKADDLRFITLTMRSSARPLGEQLDELYAGLRAFRRTTEWKQHVDGGVACVEVTWNSETREWHPHIHIIADGRFWPQRMLSTAWSRVMPGSRIVDIRPVRSRRNAAAYVAKYASKPTELDAWPPDVVREFAAAFHRRRMLLTFGTMHGAKVDGDEEREIHAVRSSRVPLGQVEQRSRLGCRHAKIVLASLARQSVPYARTLATRKDLGRPQLATDDELAAGSPRASALELSRLWECERHWFTSSLQRPTVYGAERTSRARGSPGDGTPPLVEGWLDRERQRW